MDSVNEFSAKVTLGISSKGNTRALTMALSSALTGQLLPAAIQLRLEGSMLNTYDFYFEQIAELARLNGVRFFFSTYESAGVRATRDWQLDTCATPYLWLADDDVIFHHACLNAFSVVAADLTATGFFAGSKADVNNRRSYPFFSMKEQGLEALNDKANHSLLWDVRGCWNKYAPARNLDTGNVLFNMELVRKSGCRFSVCSEHANCSGDATTFALELDKAKVPGVFVPSARAYHLEKPDGAFNEFEARKEMLLRLCDLKGYDKQLLRDNWMPDGMWKNRK